MSSTFTPLIPPGKIVLTYDDYCELSNDRNRYEILDGELFITPTPLIKHQQVSGNLLYVLGNHVATNHLGNIFPALTDVILAETTVVQPDLIFVSNERREIITDRAVEGAPTLIIEILSPITQQTDRVTKAQLYAKYGTLHYWRADPDQHTFEAYELVGDRYVITASMKSEDEFRPSLFPGLTIRLADLWA